MCRWTNFVDIYDMLKIILKYWLLIYTTVHYGMGNTQLVRDFPYFRVKESIWGGLLEFKRWSNLCKVLLSTNKMRQKTWRTKIGVRGGPLWTPISSYLTPEVHTEFFMAGGWRAVYLMTSMGLWGSAPRTHFHPLLHPQFCFVRRKVAPMSFLRMKSISLSNFIEIFSAENVTDE